MEDTEDLSLAIQHFDSLSAFGADCQKRSIDGSCFYGRSQLVHAAQIAQTGGDESRVVEAEKLIREFEDLISLESFLPSWENKIAGYLPNVPRFIAGVPDCMRMKVAVQNDKSPVSIWVVVTSSAGCSDEQLLGRGMAITALFLALSAVRSVSLRLVSGLSSNYTARSKENNIVTVQLDEPIVLGEAAWALTAQEFARGLTYGWLSTALKAGGGWPHNVSNGSRTDRVKSWKRLLNAGEEDIIFPHPFMCDPELERPIAYCKEVLEGFVMERD